MMNLKAYEDVAIIDLNGELGPQEMQQVGHTLFSLLRNRKTKMVLNFKEVEHIHYSSVPPLVEAIFKLKRFHGDLKFAGMSDYTRSIFKFMGAADYIENFRTVPEAVLAFRSGWRTWH